jgi:archaellum component FlaG (FlaF/FlaG flagellin family)
MKNISIKIIYAMVTVMIAAVVIGILALKTDRTTYDQNACGDGHSYEAIISNPVPESCTIFTASHGDTVLFGNNEGLD